MQGFAFAGKDGKFDWAQATISGDSIVVSSAEVSEPVAVQYAWDKHSPWANLFKKGRTFDIGIPSRRMTRNRRATAGLTPNTLAIQQALVTY